MGCASSKSADNQIKRTPPPPAKPDAEYDSFEEEDDLQDSELKGTVMKDGKEFCSNRGQYLVIKEVGRGAFGIAKLCLDVFNENRPCVVKSVAKTTKSLTGKEETGMKELAIMKKLSHINVIKLYDVIDEETSDKLQLVMEYASGGVVAKMSEPLSEEECWRGWRDMLTGLNYLHNQRCAHRDLKAENVLKDEQGRAKLADFGSASIFEAGASDQVGGSVGTPAFSSPEIAAGGKYSAFTADMWALGVTLYQMVYGTIPYTEPDKYKLYKQIADADDVITFPEHVGDAAVTKSLCDLLKGLLNKNLEKRIGLKEAMSHPWTTRNAKAPLESENVAAVEVSREEIDNAIQHSGGGATGGGGDSLFLNGNFPIRRFKKGEIICRQGDPATEAYFIAQGSISTHMKVTLEVKDGAGTVESSERQVSLWHTGTFVGEMEMLLGQGDNRTASCRAASEDVEVVVINKQSFFDILKDQPEVTEKLREASRRKRDLRKELGEKLKSVLEVEMKMTETLMTPELQGKMRTIRLKAGEFLFRQGEEPIEAFYIREGTVDVVMTVDLTALAEQSDPAEAAEAEAEAEESEDEETDGEVSVIHKVVGVKTEGTFTGELAIIQEDKVRKVSGKCTTDVEVITLPKEMLLKIVMDDPKLKAKLTSEALSPKTLIREKSVLKKKLARMSKLQQ